MPSPRIAVVVLAVVLTALTLVAMAGHTQVSGPTVVELSEDHGLHVLDFAVLLGWAAGMGCCAALWGRVR